MYNTSLSSKPRSNHACELSDLGRKLSIPIIHMRHNSSPILGTTVGPTRSYGTDSIPTRHTSPPNLGTSKGHGQTNSTMYIL